MKNLNNSRVCLFLAACFSGHVTGFAPFTPAPVGLHDDRVTGVVRRRLHMNLKSRTTDSSIFSSTSETSAPRASKAPTETEDVGEPSFPVSVAEADYDYRSAIQRSIGWISAAAVFGGALWTVFGSEVGEEFFAGYLVEQSLSVDNLFVFLLLFEYFKVPLSYQDRVLSWGIYGAIVMRATMISFGSVALSSFHEVLLIFAAVLVASAVKFFLPSADDDEDEDPGNNAIVRFSKGLINSTDSFDGPKFFTMVDGVRRATPLLICLVAVEISDVVFAVDSIPAVFGVTENPLIVFSSNMFAIMGLRSLYTILSKAAMDVKYLEPAVAIVLGFIGSKMIAEYFGYIIPTALALSVVATLLVGGIGASVVERKFWPDVAGEQDIERD